MNTTSSKFDQVREISAKLTVHEDMVKHLTRCLEVLISSPEVVQPPPKAELPKVVQFNVPAKPRKVPKKTKKSKAAPAPAKITGAMMETKRKILLRLSHTKPQLLSQIRKAVGHDFYTVKKALVALEGEKLVKSLSMKNKLGKQSVAYTLTQKN